MMHNQSRDKIGQLLLFATLWYYPGLDIPPLFATLWYYTGLHISLLFATLWYYPGLDTPIIICYFVALSWT